MQRFVLPALVAIPLMFTACGGSETPAPTPDETPADAPADAAPDAEADAASDEPPYPGKGDGTYCCQTGEGDEATLAWTTPEDCKGDAQKIIQIGGCASLPADAAPAGDGEATPAAAPATDAEKPKSRVAEEGTERKAADRPAPKTRVAPEGTEKRVPKR